MPKWLDKPNEVLFQPWIQKNNRWHLCCSSSKDRGFEEFINYEGRKEVRVVQLDEEARSGVIVDVIRTSITDQTKEGARIRKEIKMTLKATVRSKTFTAAVAKALSPQRLLH